MKAKKKRKPRAKTAKEIEVQLALGTLENVDILKALRSKKTSGDIIEMLNDVECDAPDFGPSVDYWKEYTRRELIGKHPNTPASVLASIFHQRKFIENPGMISWADVNILIHPTFPMELLREAINKLMYDPQFINDYSYLMKTIQNPNTPAEWLRNLATHKNVAVRAYVAAHLNTSPEILKSFVNDTGKTIWRPRDEIAANPNTPPQTLKTISKSLKAEVRKRVANNPSTSVSVLKAMITGDRSNNIRTTALYTLFKLGKVMFTDE